MHLEREHIVYGAFCGSTVLVSARLAVSKLEFLYLRRRLKIPIII